MVDRQATPSVLEVGAWRCLGIFRVLALVYAAVVLWTTRDVLVRPWLAWSVLGVLVLWTLVSTLLRWRTRTHGVGELVLVCAAILATPLVHTPGALADGATTIPAMFAAAPVAGLAVLAGVPGGLLAAAAVVAADLLVVPSPTEGTVYNCLLLLLEGATLGLLVTQARQAQALHDEATRTRAQVRERERLARAVHDDVLQNLAFIHRRGDQLGGEAARLGRLAAESERALRALAVERAGRSLPEPGPGAPGREPTDRCDLRAQLRPLGGPRVEVVTPREPVLLATTRAHELRDAVAACLDNVRDHAGPKARAWVLVEEVDDEVQVTVRDDGVGMAQGRLAEAEREGRLGVACSVVGRLADLGGSVRYRGGPGRGTMVELRAPRDEEAP